MEHGETDYLRLVVGFTIALPIATQVLRLLRVQNMSNGFANPVIFENS
jgi:hypothetical protein